MSGERRYSQNPDVSCRPEEPEGGILYNPVEDAIEMINMTGLTIWRLLQERTIGEIVSQVRDIFEGVPEDQLEDDVKAFIMHLVDRRFINEVL